MDKMETRLIETVFRMVKAMESMATDIHDIREFLIETTMRDLDNKTKKLRKESRGANEQRQAASAKK